MPRGAAVVYPKDAGQIVTMADIFPGRPRRRGRGRVRAPCQHVAAAGRRRPRRRCTRSSAARTSPTSPGATPGPSSAAEHPAWTVTVGDLVEALPDAVEAGTVDRVVLDMLAPWECLDAVADALMPGGVLICYVATTTQLSRVAEAIRDHGGFTEPQAWESLVRGWHLEGLAVRPEHRMHGHTGFLITTRRLAPGVTPPLRKRRPAKGAVRRAPPADARGHRPERRVDARGPRRASSVGEEVRRVRRICDSNLRSCRT